MGQYYGSILVKNGYVLTMDEERVIAEAKKAVEEISTAAAEDYMKADSHLAMMKKGLL